MGDTDARALETLERVGTGLADPTRRRILLELLEGSAYPADLAARLGVGRTKVSNHLTCLGAVSSARVVREGTCDTTSRPRGSPTPLPTSSTWNSMSKSLTRISMADTDLHDEGQHASLSLGPSRPEGAAAVSRARSLNAATIGWNTVEGVVAVSAGLVAGSVSLVGFGFDSAIEVSAALILAWRLRQERRDHCMQDADARATKAIALSVALAVYVSIEAIRDLAGHAEPRVSVVGVGLAALSLAVMPVLARAKAKLAPVLGSTAAAADAAQTNLCAMLSAVVLVGLVANWLVGWWWADPVAGLCIAASPQPRPAAPGAPRHSRTPAVAESPLTSGEQRPTACHPFLTAPHSHGPAGEPTNATSVGRVMCVDPWRSR